MKPSELPLDQVRHVLQQCEPALDIFEKAAYCRSCNWPAVQSGVYFNFTAIRSLSRVLSLKVGLAIAENRPDDAIKSLQTGLAVARHLGSGPTLIHGMVGIAVAALTCRNIPAYAELSNTPNLYDAIAALPSPFIDVEKLLQAEIDALDSNPQVNLLNRSAFLSNLKPAHDRVRLIAKRLNRDIAAIQCLEAIRLYVSENNGSLPQTLDSIKVPVPKDELNNKPFEYSCTGNQAMLSSPAPEGDGPRAALRYEITATKTDTSVRFSIDRVEAR